MVKTIARKVVLWWVPCVRPRTAIFFVGVVGEAPCVQWRVKFIDITCCFLGSLHRRHFNFVGWWFNPFYNDFVSTLTLNHIGMQFTSEINQSIDFLDLTRTLQDDGSVHFRKKTSTNSFLQWEGGGGASTFFKTGHSDWTICTSQEKLLWPNELKERMWQNILQISTGRVPNKGPYIGLLPGPGRPQRMFYYLLKM